MVMSDCLKDLDCVILAGGLGTRLGLDVPKVLAPVNGRPFLEYLLDWLEYYGARRIILALGWQGHQVLEYLKSAPKRKNHTNLIFSCEDEPPAGETGALINAYTKGYLKSNPVLVMNGDTFVAGSFSRFIELMPKNESRLLCTLSGVSTGVRLVTHWDLWRHEDQIMKSCFHCQFHDIGTPEKLAQFSEFFKEHVGDLS